MMIEAKTAPLMRLTEIDTEDKDTMLLLIDLFIRQTPEHIASIAAHSLAKNPSNTKIAAHTLKGVCMNLGFEDMVNICIKIEGDALQEDFINIPPLIQQLQSNFEGLCTSLNQLKK